MINTNSSSPTNTIITAGGGDPSLILARTRSNPKLLKKP